VTVRPVEASRPSPELIHVRFSDGTVAELACPAAVIGNPIAREIVVLDYLVARSAGDMRPPWQAPDAGEYAAELEQITQRMPEGYRRAIDVEPGWYPLVVETHRHLLRAAADYVPLQVEQSKAELRYRVWHDDPAVRLDLFAVTTAAEKRSVSICEWCGGDALPEPHRSGSGSGWAMRLCGDCAEFRDRWNAAWS
jgi:hypothetical protein